MALGRQDRNLGRRSPGIQKLVGLLGSLVAIFSPEVGGPSSSGNPGGFAGTDARRILSVEHVSDESDEEVRTTARALRHRERDANSGPSEPRGVRFRGLGGDGRPRRNDVVDGGRRPRSVKTQARERLAKQIEKTADAMTVEILAAEHRATAKKEKRERPGAPRYDILEGMAGSAVLAYGTAVRSEGSLPIWHFVRVGFVNA